VRLVVCCVQSWQSLIVRRQRRFQSTLRNFQRFTGSMWAGIVRHGGVMRVGRWCDNRDFPKKVQACRPTLAKARSVLVPAFPWWEEKLAAPFGLCTSASRWLLPKRSGSHRQEMSCCRPQLTCRQLKPPTCQNVVTSRWPQVWVPRAAVCRRILAKPVFSWQWMYIFEQVFVKTSIQGAC